MHLQRKRGFCVSVKMYGVRISVRKIESRISGKKKEKRVLISFIPICYLVMSSARFPDPHISVCQFQIFFLCLGCHNLAVATSHAVSGPSQQTEK